MVFKVLFKTKILENIVSGYVDHDVTGLSKTNDKIAKITEKVFNLHYAGSLFFECSFVKKSIEEAIGSSARDCIAIKETKAIANLIKNKRSLEFKQEQLKIKKNELDIDCKNFKAFNVGSEVANNHLDNSINKIPNTLNDEITTLTNEIKDLEQICDPNLSTDLSKKVKNFIINNHEGITKILIQNQVISSEGNSFSVNEKNDAKTAKNIIKTTGIKLFEDTLFLEENRKSYMELRSLRSSALDEKRKVCELLKLRLEYKCRRINNLNLNSDPLHHDRLTYLTKIFEIDLKKHENSDIKSKFEGEFEKLEGEFEKLESDIISLDLDENKLFCLDEEKSLRFNENYLNKIVKNSDTSLKYMPFFVGDGKIEFKRIDKLFIADFKEKFDKKISFLWEQVKYDGKHCLNIEIIKNTLEYIKNNDRYNDQFSIETIQNKIESILNKIDNSKNNKNKLIKQACGRSIDKTQLKEILNKFFEEFNQNFINDIHIYRQIKETNPKVKIDTFDSFLNFIGKVVCYDDEPRKTKKVKKNATMTKNMNKEDIGYNNSPLANYFPANHQTMMNTQEASKKDCDFNNVEAQEDELTLLLNETDDARILQKEIEDFMKNTDNKE